MSALELMSAFVQEDSFSTESIKHHKHGIITKYGMRYSTKIIATTAAAAVGTTKANSMIGHTRML